MVRRAVIGFVLIAGMVVAGPGASARAQGAAKVPELNGQWRFEPKRSDTMTEPGGGSERRGPRGGMGGEGGGFGRGRGGMGGGMGGAGGPGGMRGGRGGPGGEGEQGPRSEGTARRPVRLPDLMHITQTDEIVSFEDSTGVVLREITVLGGAKDTLSHAPGAAVLSGEWKGDTLVVEHQGSRGGKVTETIRLEEKGNLLVIRTKFEGSGDMPARESKRAYARVTE